MEHPPLFLSVADAITWLDSQPKAPRSPAFRALWAGLAFTGGTASSNELIALARTCGVLDGVKVTDTNLVSKIPPLVKCGLLRRVRPPLYAPKTTGCNGVKIGKRYHYIATKIVTSTPSEAARTVPDEFIVLFPAFQASPCLYVRLGDAWILKGHPDLPSPRNVDQVIGSKHVEHAFHNPANKVFTLRRTGNHYDA